jgi:Zn-dependent protease
MFLNFSLPVLITRIATLLIAFTFHEFAHAVVATALGDTTPKASGRLTINPLSHLDPMGTIALILAGFGWAKPVPVDPNAVTRKTKAGMMLVSLAGPATNLLLALLAAIPLRFGWVPLTMSTSKIFPTWGEFLLEFLFLNLSLFLFNLLPLAPLDGEKIITYFLPEHWVEVYKRIRPFSPFILIVIVFILPMLGLNVMNVIIGEPVLDMTLFLIGSG